MKKNEEEVKEIRGYKKEDMLYPDRCMMKWQGMLLSDHTEAIKRKKDIPTKIANSEGIS